MYAPRPGPRADERPKKERFDDLEGYRRMLNHAHEHFEWDDDSDVVLLRFEKR